MLETNNLFKLCILYYLEAQLKAIFIITLFTCNFAFAQNNQQLINEIIELTRVVRDEARKTTATEQALLNVRNNLEDAIELLRGGNNNQECFEYAYQKYFSSNSSSAAAEKASNLCKTVQDVPVLKFAFEKYYSSNSTENAINKAGAVASKSMRNKLDMVTFAFEKYYSASSSESAMNKASNGISLVRSGSLDCLKRFFDIHYSGNSSTVAMDKSIESCKQ